LAGLLGALTLALLAAARPAGAGERPHLLEAWSRPDLPLAERVEATHSAALELGIRSVEPAARALLANLPAGGPERVEVARAAARLAPDLPAAHFALASALAAEWELVAATRAAAASVLAFGRSLDAGLWLQAAGFRALGVALVAGAALYLLLAALFEARAAAHDLGDRLSRQTPDFSRAALLGVVLLAPAAVGEGLLGLCLGCLVVALAWRARGFAAEAVAAALLVAGLHPALLAAGRALAAFHADPVAVAAHTAEHGLAWPMHLARLSRQAAADPLAARALALGVKRTGNLAEAAARYEALLATEPGDPELLNNAANVRLALGDVDGAIALYEEAVRIAPASAVGWFNLSQAWGAALNVVELDAALARAQALDHPLVEDLSEIQGRAIHFVADLPVPNAVLHRRLLAAGDAAAVAADLRRPLAPGPLGSSPLAAGAATAAAVGLGLGLRGRFRVSRACERCGARVCPRCDGAAPRGLCAACDHVAHAPETTDPALRAARVAALARRRERAERIWLALGIAVPGVAGLRLGWRAHALASCVAAAAALASWLGRHGPAPDPLAAGGAGPGLALAAAALFALAYAALLAGALAAARRL
jgi:tetratricopeptide (TPR) repeat protein